VIWCAKVVAGRWKAETLTTDIPQLVLFIISNRIEEAIAYF
jgi:hypothetical protein